ncbi:unnamed protein product [Staurois parvus]|uniref:Uncharacterized protein n=1 Tax=Staurois parvus TaxID=386267 RepID=A0ABN9H5J8_9NEOB|nr:unnamed protein product [Staurois parvus]
MAFGGIPKLFNFGMELPLNIHTRPKGLGVDGKGDPPKGLVWMGGGTPCRFYLLWCWFLNVIFPFFFLHYSSEIQLSLPPDKRESFLGIYIPKGNNVYFEFIKRYKVFCNFGESDF